MRTQSKGRKIYGLIFLIIILLFFVWISENFNKNNQSFIDVVSNVYLCDSVKNDTLIIQGDNPITDISICGLYYTNYGNVFFATLFMEGNNGDFTKILSSTVNSENDRFVVSFKIGVLPGIYKVVVNNGRVDFGTYLFTVIQE